MILLARHILTEPWIVEQATIDSLLPLATKFVSGDLHAFADKVQPNSKYSISPTGEKMFDNPYRGIDSFAMAPAGSIAVLDIKGVLVKEDGPCGVRGTSTMLEELKVAANNPNIKGIIIDMDSPGGMVNGTVDLGEAIAKVKKPVVTHVTGMAASGGYWLASASHHIMASNELVMFGSIGVVSTIVDPSGAYEKEGLKVKQVFASNSTKKGGVYNESINGNDEPLISMLDVINTKFEKHVKSHRKNISNSKEEIFQGDMFFAKEAKKYGMIDSIGTFEDAVAYINNNAKTTKHTMSKNSTQEQYPNVCATLGFTDGFEANEEGVFLNEENLNVVEAALGQNVSLTEQLNDATAKQTAAEQALETAQTALAAAQAQNATDATTISGLEARIADLENKRASNGTPLAGADDNADGQKTSTYKSDGSDAVLKNSLGL